MKKNTLKNLMKEHSFSVNESKTTQETIENLIHTSKDIQVLEEEKGYIRFKYLGTKMAFFSDENYNRMRIISPITSYSNLAPKIKDSLMDSNFHLALDARYAVSEDTLYAAFLHPLSSLVAEDFESAMKQVYNLVVSFAKTYSSAQIQFTKKK